LLFATPWPATEEAVRSAGNLSGKTVIDATNPLLPDLSALALGTNTSAGEMVAQWASGANVVKAFNTVGANIMADPVFSNGGPVALFYCGDNAQAKQTVSALIAELGFEPLDAGPLTQARVLEPFALMWISLALKYGYSREIAFHFLRR
jgi:8-hydroxy-5-deazaflavin:NADPH oxidoreductase